VRFRNCRNWLNAASTRNKGSLGPECALQPEPRVGLPGAWAGTGVQEIVTTRLFPER